MGERIKLMAEIELHINLDSVDKIINIGQLQC